MHCPRGMLPLLLAAVIAQASPTPQIFVPGASYDAALVDGLDAAPALALCPEGAQRAQLRFTHGPLEPTRQVAASACGAPILLIGTEHAVEAVLSPGEADAGANGLRLHLGRRFAGVLRTTPFSDGGVRVTLQIPSGEAVTLFASPAPGAESELVAAGDFNGDGRLDLVLSSTEGLTRYQQLFLSDEAGLPRLTTEVVLSRDGLSAS